ncbi:hypothetical protein ACNFU2_20170 [Chryseobacterium sp. PTM-20240506]|nr:hypothetical protein [Chryseobacterium sp. B21-037]MDC8102929.1 hypothetical protein [Chryseobacterium sp. B21-037]WBV56415.1 hypothetical protein PFY10_19700 [Chryseobacterium daecheongense]
MTKPFSYIGVINHLEDAVSKGFSFAPIKTDPILLYIIGFGLCYYSYVKV